MVKRAGLVLLLAAGVVLPAAAAEPVVGGPGEIPSVDVEASVRKMLEEGRSRGAAPSPADAVEVPAAGSAPSESPAAARARPAPPRQDEMDFVPLPEGDITVRSVGDVDAVKKELDEARRNTPATESAGPHR